MKRKTILSLTIALCLAFATSFPVLASETGVGAGEDAEISVTAKVVEADLMYTIYSVDIEWGDMKFVYSNGQGKWDPDTHTYVGDLAGTAGWWNDNGLETSDGTPTEYYLEQGNNKITITNHSNGAIDAEFSYAMENAIFNDSTGDDNVVGGFYASEADAKAGALILTAPSGNAAFNTLTDSKVSLPTAIGRDTDSDEISTDAYFALSGTPDTGRSETLADFTQVGTITVTITPNADAGLNTPGV